MEIMPIKHAHDLHVAKPDGCFLLFIVLSPPQWQLDPLTTPPLKGCSTMVPAPPYSPNIFHLTLASPLLGSVVWFPLSLSSKSRETQGSVCALLLSLIPDSA